MPEIHKKYPGKSAEEIFTKVHRMMDDIARKMELSYQSDATSRTGKVSKMGVSGAYTCRDGEVRVDLKFPMLLPGSVKQKVQGEIEQKLDGLFA